MNTRTRLFILTAETLFGFVAAQAQSNLPPLVVKREPPKTTASGSPPSSSPAMTLPTQEELQQAAAALGAANPPEITPVTGAGPQNSLPGTPSASPASKPVPTDYKVKNDVALDATGAKALAISSDYLTKTNVPSQGKDGRVVYTFGSGLPLVVCAPLRLTTIELEPGEKLVAKPQPGDEVRWDIIPSISGAGDGAQTVVFLRPHESGLDTNLILTTDRRLYYLRIVSKPVDYVARVAFAYPEQSGKVGKAIKRSKRVYRLKNRNTPNRKKPTKPVSTLRPAINSKVLTPTSSQTQCTTTAPSPTSHYRSKSAAWMLPCSW